MNLKLLSCRPDRTVMFFSADGPADPHCSELVSLHRSMNAPVVAIEDLPVGPARAAVALSRGGDTPFNVSVAVRCERTGRIAFFTAGGELQELRSISIAIDAALSFAESMGFLFDDEEVETRGADGPRVAAKTWQRFLNGDVDGASATDPIELGETDLEIQPEDELGPILSSVAPDLDGTATRKSGGAAPETRDEAEELPFWLTISDEDTPRQSARSVEPKAGPAAPHNAVAGAKNLAAPAGESGSTSGDRNGSESRTLLMNVLAETAVDRVCATPARSGPGLSKFRLKPVEAGPQGDSPSDPSRLVTQRSEHPEVPEFRAPGDEAKPPRTARYHESTRRPHLLLRLLSRF